MHVCAHVTGTRTREALDGPCEPVSPDGGVHELHDDLFDLFQGPVDEILCSVGHHALKVTGGILAPDGQRLTALPVGTDGLRNLRKRLREPRLLGIGRSTAMGKEKKKGGGQHSDHE